MFIQLQTDIILLLLQCQINGHQYILEKTLAEVEQLLELEKKEKLQPTTTLDVPVFSLKMAV